MRRRRLGDSEGPRLIGFVCCINYERVLIVYLDMGSGKKRAGIMCGIAGLVRFYQKASIAYRSFSKE